VEIGRTGDTCFVRVIDNGPGVAEEIRPRLFEPFVTGRSNGVGIGLALSRRIARAHGGDLRLVDNPRGTCFELTLPEEGSR
jgi:signal transduction histidine kinase